MRRRYIAAGTAAVVLIAALLAFAALRGGPRPERTPEPTAAVAPASPTPLTATPTPTTAPTATAVPATPSPTPRPSPTPVGQFVKYVSASMGYAIELKPPWHRATCGSSLSGGPLENTNGADLFIPIPDADYRPGHVGPLSGNADSIHVWAIANPERLSLRDFKRGRIGESSAERIEDATFVGRPALKITDGDNASFLFANDGYVWYVGHRLRTGSTSFAEREAMMFSFRFLTADEIRAARAAATPAPAPRSAEQVADVLAEGFAKRDVTILARVIHPCVHEGNYQAGPDSMTSQTFLDRLRERFAKGLVVDVRARPVNGDPNATMRVRSMWREPGQPDREADLSITFDRGVTAYWSGTTYGTPP